MRQLKKASCALLAVLLVFSLGGFAVFDAHALVLDPVAWLYPIWQMYGAQAGVTVSTMGGDEFTQQGFTSLFDEWQQSEVASGFASAVQTIGDFVESVREFVDIGAGSTSGGTLWSRLRLAAGITSKLARFWNWIIVDKLGGTSVDSVDFSQNSGNLGSASSSFLLSSFRLSYGFRNQYPYWASYLGVSRYPADFPDVALFSVGSLYYAATPVSDVAVGVMMAQDYDLDISYPISSWSRPNDCICNTYDSTSGLFFGQGKLTIVSDSVLPSFPDVRTALDSLSLSGSGVGSLTVTADPGVDVLGFPDTSDPAYVPSDAVIPWNIPYDQTKDTNGYLDEAYEKALDNELTDQPDTSNPPVEGSGTVEDVGAYVVPGLGDVFPFCIPFDIYNFLSALASDPVAPHFTANLDFPDPIGTQTIDLDFDTPTFNQLAQLLRLLELLAFIVGLAFITRSMIIRG